MEKDLAFLSEIRNTLKNLKEEIEILEVRISEYEQSLDNEPVEVTPPMDLNIKEEPEEDIIKLTVTEETDNKLQKAMIDSYADRQSWRKAIPGPTVKDIRSAISLNDRILFINTLFGEDSLKFQNTITEINAMNELQEVLDMIVQKFPEWDLDSEVVYRFMMAVRRHVK